MFNLPKTILIGFSVAVLILVGFFVSQNFSTPKVEAESFSRGAASPRAFFAGGNASIFKCLYSTGCDSAADWVAVTGFAVGANDFAVDATNDTIYGAGIDGIIYRCVLSTGCDATAEWTVSYDTPNTSLESVVFDTLNNILYVGVGSGGDDGIIYRCPTSNSCNEAGDWSAVLNTAGDAIQDIVFDSVNNVLYANNRLTFGGGSVIYRCPTNTGCDVAGEWTATFSGTAAGDSLWEIGFDETNRVLYAAGFDAAGGELWRCDITATSCDQNGDWTKPLTAAGTNFVSVLVDFLNGILYVGDDTADTVRRCNITADACDAAGDFTNYTLPSTGTNVYGLAMDATGDALYAGTGDSGIIYKCPTSSSCDASGDWFVARDTADTYIADIILQRATDYTNSGAAAAIVSRGDANVLVLDLTLYDPADTVVHNGAQASNAGDALIALPGANMFYDDSATNNNIYDDGEAVINDADADGFPTAGDTVLTAGLAGVRALTATDSVCFDQAGGVNTEYDTTDGIWLDVAGDCTSFTAGTDVILVLDPLPTGTSTEFGTEGEIGYLDNSGNGAFTCSRTGTCEPLVYSGVNGTNITNGQNLSTNTAFLDSAAEGSTNRIKQTGTAWDEVGGPEDLNAFPAYHKLRDNNGGGSYTDGEDIYLEIDPNSNSAISQGTITSVIVSNQGTATNADISGWQVWRESGATAGFQSAQDQSMAVTVAGAGPWTFTPTQNNTFTTGQRRIYVTANIGAEAGHDQTLRIQVNLNGFNMDGATASGDGPADSAFANANTISVFAAVGRKLDSTPPALPSDIKVESTGKSGELKLAWKNPADLDFAGVRIYRSTTSGSQGAVVLASTTSGSFTDSGLEDGKIYYYILESVDISGNSVKSLEVSGAPGVAAAAPAAPATPASPGESPTTPTTPATPAVPMTATEIQTKITELQLQLIDLLRQVIQMLLSQLQQ